MKRKLLAISMAALGHCACALDFTHEGFDISVHAGMTYGMGYRSQSPSPDLLSSANAATLGLSGTAAGGRNQDDGNLNFSRNDRFTEVLKGVASIEVKRGNLGAMIRAKAWNDLGLVGTNARWGNVGGYGLNTPLSDAGFSNRAQFQGSALQEAYVFGKFPFGDQALTLRVGNQFIPWGAGWSIPGGLASVTPVDLPAVHRPGALPEEMLIPTPAVFAKLEVSPTVSAEMFTQYRYRATALDGCGTFFSTYDYAAEGCNKIFIAGPNDAVSDSAALFVTKEGRTTVSNAGQFGLALRYRSETTGSEAGIFASRLHSRIPFADGIRTLRTSAAAFVPGDPGNLNPHYAMEYPEGIRTIGLDFKKEVRSATFAGELTYRPNQPVGLNTTDLLAALVSNSAPTLIRDQANATPLGGLSRGWDSLKVTQLLVSAKDKFARIAGAESITVSGEIGVKHVNNLPDVNTRRYGRSDVFGLGPINGLCAGTATQCSNNGFVTPTAWGYRLRVVGDFRNAWPNEDLSPSLTFGHDVKGWSFDGVFNQGRKFATLAVRAYYKKIYFLDLLKYSNWGGEYNTQKDRGYLMATVGTRF